MPVIKENKSAAKPVSNKRVNGNSAYDTGHKAASKNNPIPAKVKAGTPTKEALTYIHNIPAAEKISLIKNGISKNQLESIKEQSSLDYDTLSAVLSVSRATLIKKKGNDKFDQPTSERILLLADVIAYGREVFEDQALFNAWTRKESKALGGKTPLELMDTLYGMQEIKKELGRIEYGVF